VPHGGPSGKVIPLTWITRAAAVIMLVMAGLSLAAAVAVA
jgi:hypothetical protein